MLHYSTLHKNLQSIFPFEKRLRQNYTTSSNVHVIQLSADVDDLVEESD
jgi:hypothetical protein